MNKYGINGYLPEPPSGINEKIGNFLVDLVIDVLIGKHEVLYHDPLKKYGRFPCRLNKDWNLEIYTGYRLINSIVISNHSSWMDVFIFRKIHPQCRPMAAKCVMDFAFGLVGILFGKCLGCFAAEKDDKNTAIKTGASVLRLGQDLVICPEGWAFLDGKMRPFKTGAIRIAQEFNDRVYFIPTYTRYKKIHGEWINKLWPPLQYLYNAISFPWVRGAVTIIGPKIYIDELPKDVKLATQELENLVKQLEPVAIKYLN